MAEDIISELEKLKVDVDQIIQLLRSKHDGTYFSQYGGQNVPNIVLEKSDVEKLVQNL